ncbi:rCG57780, isoform CRA_e [Rattus norvegicus]|uniref:RCG57780, isoform CRA_e n=1 Tax=Rattus norvegicus TaxID=10116 RepID=A6JHK2_RAT|nr:rCG57780, isoform CRA_e [Rattus norvegicus]
MSLNYPRCVTDLRAWNNSRNRPSSHAESCRSCTEASRTNAPVGLSTRRTSSRFILSSFPKETPATMLLFSSMPLTPTTMALSVLRTLWLVCR